MINMVIGIVGGTGVGKSTIVQLISKATSTFVIDADKIGHVLLNKHGHAYSDVVSAFGNEILDAKGNIVRKLLGAVVFGDNYQLNKLNAIMHPKIYSEIKDILASIDFERYTCVLIDSALLYEIALDQLTDKVVGVYAPDELRTQRIMNRNTLSYEDALKRIDSQKSWDELSQRIDYTIFNDGTIENLEQQIEKMLAKLC